MCGEEVSDYTPFCVRKFVLLGHGRILRPKSDNTTENQPSRGSDEVSKVFIQNLAESWYKRAYLIGQCNKRSDTPEIAKYG